MSVSADAYRAALSRLASGVVIVTGVTPEGPVGLTATAFVSLSLTPPQVGIAVAESSRSRPGLSIAPALGISILGEHQRELAARFAADGDRFAGLELERGPRTGALLVPGAVAHLETRPVQTHVIGDHTLFVLEVVDTQVHGGRPLLYVSRGFARLEPTSERAPASREETAV